jgi:hypothetical protein
MVIRFPAHGRTQVVAVTARLQRGFSSSFFQGGIMKTVQPSNGGMIVVDQPKTLVAVSATTIWIGRVINVFTILFLLFDSVIKVLQLAPAVEATVQLGYPEHLVLGIGILELACLVLYAIPRTSLLGAVLLSGYLGGAIATHVRVGSDWFSLLFPVLIGGLLWASLVLRDRRLRLLIPFYR